MIIEDEIIGEVIGALVVSDSLAEGRLGFTAVDYRRNDGVILLLPIDKVRELHGHLTRILKGIE